MHLHLYVQDKIFWKIKLLFRSVINNILLYASQGKFDARFCEDRREFSYTEHIPERRSGKDRRKGIKIK